MLMFIEEKQFHCNNAKRQRIPWCNHVTQLPFRRLKACSQNFSEWVELVFKGVFRCDKITKLDK